MRLGLLIKSMMAILVLGYIYSCNIVGETMAFKLSSRSLGKLEGVNLLLVDTVKRAIEVSKVDFGVIYKVIRSSKNKKRFIERTFKTMKSKHLIQKDGTSHLSI